jgi:ABC-type branched-subunit amino acid transport system substrate-binding protein
LRRARVITTTVVLTLAAAACGGANRSEPPASNASTDATSATTAATTGPAQFGDAALPCGPAKAGATNTASDVGVTATQIDIAAGDDRGYSQTPGLNKQMTEAVQDIAKLCNDAGGINGRKVVVRPYDAAILQVQQAMAKACADKNFFLVGEGFALDSNQEETRLGCKLPAVPGYAVSAAFQNAPLMYQALPVPANKNTAMIAELIAKLHPEAITAAATLAGNFSATQQTRDKVVASYPQFGFKFLPNSNFEYPITGQTDWTPTIKQLKAAGAKFVYWSGECSNLLKAMQAARLNDFHAIWQTDTNHYDATCAASNTDGAMDGVYMPNSVLPIEESADNKAVADYLAMVKANGQKPAQLGMQATSSFLLWATAAQACGAQLTRDCVLTNLKNTHTWTGHGMHAQTDPGANGPSQCTVLLQLEGTKYVRVQPTQPGTFACDPKSVVSVNTPAVQQAKIGSDGVSHQFG